MSNPIESNGTAISVFQAHFGAPPGSLDATTECKNWQRLCDELLAEHARLRAKLEKVRLDQICSEWGPVPSMAEVYAQVDRETTLDQLVEEIERDAETEA